MTTKTTTTPETLAEVLENLGGIPLERIRMKPAPGAATEKDVLAERAGPRRRLCELVDGVLVEKTMGARESLLAMEIGRLLGNFVDEHELGCVLGPDGMLRLAPGLVRIPDVSFIPWNRIPNEDFGDAPIAEYVPGLAIEVLSPSNTKGEIARKLRDYFVSGIRLVWVVDPKKQTAQIFTSPTDFRRIAKSGALSGDPVVPGFALPLPDLFAKTRPPWKRSG
jgi:Uma2 family endonuclease